jgi:hypothetical protein
MCATIIYRRNLNWIKHPMLFNHLWIILLVPKTTKFSFVVRCYELLDDMTKTFIFIFIQVNNSHNSWSHTQLKNHVVLTYAISSGFNMVPCIWVDMDMIPYSAHKHIKNVYEISINFNIKTWNNNHWLHIYWLFNFNLYTL